MKKLLKLFGIIALAVVFAFTLMGCKDDNDGGSSGSNSKPATPKNVIATAWPSSSIVISWPAVSGALQYCVYSSESSSGTYTLLGISLPTDTGVSSYTASGLSPNTTYYFKVSASNHLGESSQSSPVSATITLSIPNAPMNVSADASSAYSITVSWSAVSGATGYYVYRSSSSSGSYNRVGTVASYTAYIATGLSANTTYYFRVSAYNSAGEGSQSSYTSATTYSQ